MVFLLPKNYSTFSAVFPFSSSKQGESLHDLHSHPSPLTKSTISFHFLFSLGFFFISQISALKSDLNTQIFTNFHISVKRPNIFMKKCATPNKNTFASTSCKQDTSADARKSWHEFDMFVPVFKIYSEHFYNLES